MRVFHGFMYSTLPPLPPLNSTFAGDPQAAFSLALGIQDEDGDPRLQITGALSATIGTKSQRRKEQRTRRRKKKRKSMKSLSENGQTKRKEKGKGATTRTILIALLLAVFIIVYPCIMVPVFRSDLISDAVRVTICCIMHPILVESTMMLVRAKIFVEMVQDIREYGKNIPSHYVLGKVTGWPQAIFGILTIYRRLMIGCIHSPSAANIAIVVVSLEEAITRATMIHRDRFFGFASAKVTGSHLEDDLDLPTLKKRLWACTLVMSIFHEITAIITCRVLYLAFRRHRFIFNFGYGFNGTWTDAITVSWDGVANPPHGCR